MVVEENEEDLNKKNRKSVPLNVDIFNDYLIVSTLKTYKAGEELWINYSKQSTLSRKDAILQYGF